MSLIGQRVGPFEIVEPAVVPERGRWWLARRAGSGRKGPDTVLVRVLDPDAGDAERGELQRTYDLLRGLEDPRVPAPVAYFEGLGALALDARVGRSLADAAAARAEGLPIGVATVVDLLLEVAETLQRAHHRNRSHGHLTPAHVVLGRDGAVSLFGFGSPDAVPDPAWAAPERLRGEAATPAADQWSLAALAVALVSGRSPWAQPGVQRAEPDPSAMVAAVDAAWPPLGALLRRMLDPTPARRFASLHPVRQELLALARRTGAISERRELAALLHRRDPVAEEEVEAVPPVPPPVPDVPSDEAPVAPRSVVPAPQRAAAPKPEPKVEPPAPSTPTAPPEEAETPRQAPIARPPPRRSREPLPEEAIPVVRPQVEGDVPIASSSRAETPFASLAPAGPFAEVVLEPTDPSSEVPLLEEMTPPPEDRSLAPEWPEPQLDESPTSPTAVPPTEPSEEVAVPSPSPAPQDAPSQAHEDWFQSTGSSTPAPGVRLADPSLGLAGLRIDAHEPAVGGDDPPSVQEPVVARPSPIDTFPITRVAPFLAGTMLALVALWFVLRVF